MTDTSRVGDSISALPFDIYVVEGQPHKAGDLRRAGIETAYTCVVLADRSCVQEIDEEAVDEYMIHQFITIEKLRSRMESHLRRPLNYVVEVLSCPTLKILDQTYKTFKGKAKRHRRHRTQGHFSDLRDRLSMLRNGSPLRGALSRSPLRDNDNNNRSPQSVSPMAAVADSLLQQQKQQQQQPSSPQQSPQQRRRQQQQRRGSRDMTSAEVATPISGEGGGASTRGVDFGVSHAAMYPFVTAGTSFLIDVFDIISCQLFYNSDLIRFVNLLLALDHHSDPAAGASGGGAGGGEGGGGARVRAAGSKAAGGAVPGRKTVQILLDDGDSDDQDMNKFAVSGRLGRIPVPSELMGQEYGDLFELLMMDFETIPIALYRHDSKADVSYVFTGPPPKTKLRMTDSVFFLAPVHTIKALLSKYGPL